MKYIKLCTSFLGVIFFGCNQKADAKQIIENNSIKIQLVDNSKDKEEIRNLIRQILNWAKSEESINLLPVMTKNNDSICIGFDFDKHNLNLKKLKATNLFAQEFIENYDQIIKTLDKRIKNKELAQWNINELPTFIFANDVDPYCLCQDIPYDNPSPWDFVEIDIINLDKGKINWKWGNLPPSSDQSWKDFLYKFRVVKENNKWKIAYLQGFDFNESTRKEGQLTKRTTIH